MLQTVKKGSSLHVVGQSTARIGEAAPFDAPVNPCERPPRKAGRAAVPSGEAGSAAAGERPRHEEVIRLRTGRLAGSRRY
ncbi:hypothetical protein [Burkholderia sp. AU36459]|uniref:hypothetical protein n=1 Tax=Burkholderia sp. AU36459 TaxID=2879632 RepID=UPI001CF5AC5F|nr:hypothetical protein [Burkholderia sp. AU36459]MCA8107096.1 hypothetical protein [Burkholderia sp. AU36459]